MYQFHFFELVLANHAASIATIAARLTAKTGRVAGEFNAIIAQLSVFENPVPGDISHRHFGGWNQVEIVLCMELEYVLLKFRQLAGALQGLPVDDVGYIDLLVAVLDGLQIEHKLGQGAL